VVTLNDHAGLGSPRRNVMEDSDERLSGIKVGDWLRIGDRVPSLSDSFSQVTRLTKTQVIVSVHQKYRYSGQPVGGTYSTRWAYPATPEQAEVWQQKRRKIVEKRKQEEAERQQRESQPVWRAARYINGLLWGGVEEFVNNGDADKLIAAAKLLGWDENQ
jgi:hypothetical protein